MKTSSNFSKSSKKKKSKPFKELYGKPLFKTRMRFTVKKKDADGKTYMGSETLVVSIY
jgi:hypothetical protein